MDSVIQSLIDLSAWLVVRSEEANCFLLKNFYEDLWHTWVQVGYFCNFRKLKRLVLSEEKALVMGLISDSHFNKKGMQENQQHQWQVWRSTGWGLVTVFILTAGINRQYTNKNYVSSKAEKMQKSVVLKLWKRHIQSAHESKNDANVPLCLFCNQKAKAGKKGNSKSAHELIPVWTMQCQESVLWFCTQPNIWDRASWTVWLVLQLQVQEVWLSCY